MKTWTFTVGSSNQTGTLSWNAIGTLGSLAIVDGFNSVGTQTCNFGTSGNMGYDDWNRLVYDDCGSGNWGQQFSYDQYDNLTKSVISGRTGTTFNPGYNSSNNQFASGFGATYDSNGNLTWDTRHYYAWNEFSKVKSIDLSGANCASGGECLVYDASGRVVEIDSGGAAEEILYSPVGKTAVMNGTTVNYAYIPMPGGSIMYKPNDTTHRYWHRDWLGNTRVEATLSSVVQGGYAFSPYGELEATYGTITNEVNFTGDTQDIVSGIFDTPNRELSSMGRWISPDPAGDGWNQYAYSTNPNSDVDPTGLDASNCPFQPKRGCGSNWPEYDEGGGDGSGYDDQQIVFGYDIFDAIAGASGTYLYTDFYGNLSFGFDENLWTTTYNFIDGEAQGISPSNATAFGLILGSVTTQAYLPSQEGWQFYVQDLGNEETASGTLPTLESLTASLMNLMASDERLQSAMNNNVSPDIIVAMLMQTDPMYQQALAVQSQIEDVLNSLMALNNYQFSQTETAYPDVPVPNVPIPPSPTPPMPPMPPPAMPQPPPSSSATP